MSKPMDKLLSEFGFVTPIPDEIIALMPKIKPSGFTVWCYLMSRIYNAKREDGNFNCFPSINTISEKTGIGISAVGRAINRLESEGLLTKTRRFGNSTIYTLTGTEVQKVQNEQTEAAEFIFNSPVGSKRTYQLVQNEPIESSKRTTNQDKVNQDEVNQDEDININTRLAKIGIKPSAAKRLLNSKTPKRLKHGLDVYEQGLLREKELKPGWFMDFINDDWDDPGWYEPDSDSDDSRQRYLNGLEG